MIASFKPGKPWLDTTGKTIQAPDSDLYIAMADRWQPGAKHAWGHKLTETYYKHMFRNYKPDTSAKETTRLSDKELTRYENTCKSTYVWLLIRWENDVPKLYWYDEWYLV